MYDELVKQLQDYAAGTMRDDDAEIALDAINAIEKLEHKVFILEGDREGLLAQIPRWIPVTERLPEAGVYVLAYSADDGYMCVEARHKFSAFQITHWQPLPEPPEEET